MQMHDYDYKEFNYFSSTLLYAFFACAILQSGSWFGIFLV